MKIVGILVLVGSIVFSSITNAQSFGSLFSKDFQTVAWQNCELAPCHLINPKPWSLEEDSFIQSTITKFKMTGLRHIISTLKMLGYTSFERAQYWHHVDMTQNMGLGKAKFSDFTHAVTLNEAYKHIVITDIFFNDPVKTDPTSQANMQELTLLHEMAHAYDSQGRYSDSVEFTKLAGFSPGFNKTSSDNVDKANKEYYDLRDRKEFQKAHDQSREFGMKHGMPRIYSMGNAAEAFADIVAFIYFDPNTPKYLDHKLIEYIDNNVLKGARNF